MRSPPAEIDVDEGLIRGLLAEQHPDLADRPLVELDAGWDNTLWRLGDDLLVRLPRRAAAAELTEHEQRWLPQLASVLPLPVPVPLRVGGPSDRYPWSWSVVPWIDGTPADRAPAMDATVVAGQLGAFLRALHRPAPAARRATRFAGCRSRRGRTAFEARASELDAVIDGPAARAVWDCARGITDVVRAAVVAPRRPASGERARGRRDARRGHRLRRRVRR